MELIINRIGDQGAKPDVSHAPAVMEQEFIPLGLQWYSTKPLAKESTAKSGRSLKRIAHVCFDISVKADFLFFFLGRLSGSPSGREVSAPCLESRSKGSVSTIALDSLSSFFLSTSHSSLRHDANKNFRRPKHA